MAAKTLRVHQLAKELGVQSKVIVEKCQAEGVPDITNHMSTVKLGLAETIRQWFGESAEATAIETADRIDLSKVKKRRARAKSAGEADGGGTATVEAEDEEDTGSDEASLASSGSADDEPTEEEATVQAEVAEPAVLKTDEEDAELAEVPAMADAEQTQDEADVTPQAAQVEAQAADEQGAEQADAGEAVDDEQSPDAQDPSKARPKALGRPNVPDRPNVVKPAGEQLTRPQQATLKGPKVVRVEKPEPVEAPRPRGPRGPRTGGPGGRPQEFNEVEGISRSRGPARGRGAGGGTPTPDRGRPNKQRRQLNTRRGRTGDALPSGPSQFSQADMEELDARLKGSSGFLKQRRRDLRKREGGFGPAATAVQTGGKVPISEPITIKSLSAATGIKTAEILKFLFTQKKVMATVNSAIDTEAAMEIALEYNIELEVKEQETAEQTVLKQFEEREQVDVRSRPPVVTVLGHVDHGKTSLLDRIRKEDVAAHEAGGITQHVGAYRVTVPGSDGSEKSVVFLDTPGHEAFTSMRARGASMTDIVVLVVAADDGVMPQTVESINHAKAAKVPVIVALNKVDLPQATDDNIQKIYGQLAEHGLNPTPWGGETEVVRTSAETGEGITELIELLDLQAEVLELKADYGGPARGTVIEAEMQPGRGAVARVLVQQGQMKVGDFINIGRAFGRVRDMSDDRGKAILEAGPATPLELSGIDEIPDAGDKFYITGSLRKAEEIARQYREAERQKQLASQTKVTLDNFAATVAAGQIKELRVVLKADVQGTLDVLRKSLEDIGNKEVAVKVIHSAVGGVTESDIVLADASDAIVVGFHVIATPAVREIAESRHVDIRLYRVIYDVVDDVKLALEGMLAPERRETELGTAEVRQVFKISKLGSIAGCLVTEGSIEKSAKTRVVRDGRVVTDERSIESLRRVKDDVREVRVGTECGIRLANFEDLKPGDQIIAYRVEEVARKLQ